MAYSTHTINTMGEIAALVVAAVNTAGWTNNGTDTITLPGGMTVILSSIDTTSEKSFRLEDTTDNTRYTEFRGPYLNGTATGVPADTPPTKLHLFTGATPDDFVAGVVEFGFNAYRHFYLGHMEKIGNYTSEGILSSNQFDYTYGSTTYPDWKYPSNRYLFGARCIDSTIRPGGGGVDIQHIDRIDPDWARLGDQSTSIVNAQQGLTTNNVLGGNMDGINTVHVHQAKSAFAGQNVLVPPNLYLTEGAGTTVRLRPIGKPHGVRLVNMQDLDTDTSIVVGADTWRVFAEFRRTNFFNGTRDAVAPNRYLNEELSYYLGLAYLEG